MNAPSRLVNDSTALSTMPDPREHAGHADYHAGIVRIGPGVLDLPAEISCSEPAPNAVNELDLQRRFP
jgi:hypothetical protein